MSGWASALEFMREVVPCFTCQHRDEENRGEWKKVGCGKHEIRRPCKDYEKDEEAEGDV
jgi:hypothetical protein